MNLPELVTQTDAEYEALALELATDPARLAAVRAKLAANRLASPLFDTQAYTRHFEAGMDMAYDRFMAGLPPADIVVPA
jgi:predicted O-linked N-acetylglucosamine transferase (SPINDLY family)